MNKYTKLIKISGLTIYDSVPENLYIPNDDLEIILREGLRGFSTAGLPIRTRSKIVKSIAASISSVLKISLRFSPSLPMIAKHPFR